LLDDLICCEWTLRPRRGLTRLTWISGALCRKFAVSPVCPRFPPPRLRYN
jgi:hypothetical protein